VTISKEQIDQALINLSNAAAYANDLQHHADAIIAELQHVRSVLAGMDVDQPPRVLFCSPVTGVISATPNPYGLDWYDATGYCTYYQSNGVYCYHTGADLNRPAFGDSGKPVYAAADGVVVFAGVVSGWQQKVVTIKHTLEDGSNIWTRYAHITNSVVADKVVNRGDQIGVIAEYMPVGPAGDHCHWDVCIDDLGSRPGDWPGMDKARVLAHYKDPSKWLTERSK
jgi:murein DD-endopeptidase MepM/ murein hydrolase activator NlpD